MSMNAQFAETYPIDLGLNGDACDFESDLALKNASSFGTTAATPLANAQAIDRRALNVLRSQATTTFVDGLPSRMQLVIQSEGSMASIARRCGFSEGAVRSWRDGHSDMSRERCVVMARTLGISLLWLVTGEGPMKEVSPAGKFKLDERSEPTRIAPLPMSAIDQPGPEEQTRTPAVNPRVLGAALRLLQSYVGLLGGSLNLTQRADALAELYDILGTSNDPDHIDRLIAFHVTLNSQVRRGCSLVT